MIMTREQLRDLAAFHDQKSCALSFYFQPSAPRNKAHKEDSILIKDLARDVYRRLEESGASKDAAKDAAKHKERRDSLRSDLDRILRLSLELRSNGTHARAVFACAAQNLWQEFELPAVLPGTQLFVDSFLHLKPLAHLLGAFPRLGVVLVDRHRARFFDLRLGELTEREGLFHALSRKGRSDGYAGYDGGHAQRRDDEEARQHFKNVADTLKQLLEKGAFENWILGCQDVHRFLLDPHLHPYVHQAMLGRFPADLFHITRDGILAQAQQIVEDWQQGRRRQAVSEALDQARSQGRGVTGLRRVLKALEMGEVQTLLLGENFQSHAVECLGCGHLDAHLVASCPVCGRATQEVVDVGEALLPFVIRRDIETFYVKDDPEFDNVGNIAALLRFRAENVQPISGTVASRLAAAGAAYPGRLRKFASR